MTRWQFDENMIQMFKSIVGKQFLSFEMDSSVEGQSYGIARLIFDKTSILLKNEEEEIAMLEMLSPSAIICFGTPFKEMRGNILAVDYLASRKVVR